MLRHGDLIDEDCEQNKLFRKKKTNGLKEPFWCYKEIYLLMINNKVFRKASLVPKYTELKGKARIQQKILWSKNFKKDFMFRNLASCLAK